MYQQRSFFGGLTPVVKNLLIINGLVFFAFKILGNGITIPGIIDSPSSLNQIFGLYTPGSEQFFFFQYITYMFLHANFTHILFNMFALFMFGRILEQVWGPKKFLFYYFVTGIGAGLLNVLISFARVKILLQSAPPELLEQMYASGKDILMSGQNYVDPVMAQLNMLLNIPTVGASGAIFGLLLAFGMLFPNEQIYLYMIVPIKAKWFVMGYAALEMYSMVANNPGDNVAHLAHLGGMLFGYLLIVYWRKKGI